jgi:hypothetical protein
MEFPPHVLFIKLFLLVPIDMFINNLDLFSNIWKVILLLQYFAGVIYTGEAGIAGDVNDTARL